MANTMANTLSKPAMDFVLERAYLDIQSYMESGNPSTDYDDGWPEVAREQAMFCREVAEVTGEQRWTNQAEALEQSAAEAAGDAVCGSCRTPYGQKDVDGGRCVSCGTMIA